MKSIRLSLTVYFLVLLAVALGTASLLVYRTAKSSLQARQHGTEELLKAKKATAVALLESKHRQEIDRTEKDLDGALLSQARTLAGLAQFEVNWPKFPGRPYNFVGALGAATVPNGHLFIPLWVAEGEPRQGPRGWGRHESVSNEIYARLVSRFLNSKSLKTEIKLTSTDLLDHVDEQVAEFFQINSAWGSAYYSQKMDGRSFDFDPAVFKGGKAVEQSCGDAQLGPHLKVRRAIFKAPAARHVPFGGLPRIRPGHRRGPDAKRGPGPKHGPDRGAPPPPPRPEQLVQPGLYIQCACSTARRDAAIAVLAADLKKETRQLDARLADDVALVAAETDKSLRSLRSHLLAVSLFTFAAAVFGTFILVRLGLAPLHRLGEAVGRVSEKDFRLQYEAAELPRELSPIAEALGHTLEQLERAFTREKQATADISHELRTPLSALLTTIDVTLRKPRSAEEYRDALTDCRASGQQIHQAVERLLALARLDAGVEAVRRQQVDAADLAKQCVAVVRPLAEARGLSVNVRGEGPASLNTDPAKLREVLNNLLHNAIEYNRPNGRIDVAVARNNGHLCLEVQDTGIGIAPAARTRIFERFFRADPSRQADGLHAGLGLAIVKGYVDLMGGTIDVASVEGQGSTFSVRLPA